MINHNIRKACERAVGTTRICNEGGSFDGVNFEFEIDGVDGVTQNLTDWWEDRYPFPPSEEEAEEFLEEIYPENKEAL